MEAIKTKLENLFILYLYINVIIVGQANNASNYFKTCFLLLKQIESISLEVLFYAILNITHGQ